MDSQIHGTHGQKKTENSSIQLIEKSDNYTEIKIILVQTNLTTYTIVIKIVSKLYNRIFFRNSQ